MALLCLLVEGLWPVYDVSIVGEVTGIKSFGFWELHQRINKNCAWSMIGLSGDCRETADHKTIRKGQSVSLFV